MAHLPKGQGVFLPPFKAWLASNIPAVYDNTMTYYEELCALIKYLQDVVIPALNHNAEAVTTIATAVEQLQKYVEDYFKNLDVQEEINNKLDQMTEDGTLLNLILPYISGKHKVIFMPVSSDIDTNTASGDCSVIKTVTGKVIMIDTGATHSYDLIKAELDANGITKIDYLIISHFHGDHTSNIINLDNDFDFAGAKFYLPKHTDVPSDITPNSETEVLQVATLNNCEVIRPDSNDYFEVDDIKFTFFNCSASDYSYYDSQSASLNDYSMCCYADCGNNSILFTGDLGYKGCQHCYSEGYLKKCNILKIPHHGLIYGLGNPSDFTLTVNPEYGLASVSNAYLDTFSLSGSEMDIALQANGTKMFATYDNVINAFFNKTEYSVYADNELYTKFNRSSSSSNVYVDSTYTGESDGTSLKPYNSLTSALAFAQKQVNTSVKINVIGTYNSSEEIRIQHTLSEIEVSGNITVLSLTILDSKVVFDDSITATAITQSPVNILRSTVKFNTLTINGDSTGSDTVGGGRGLNVAEESNVSINTLSISNRSLGYYISNLSRLRIGNLTGTGNTYGYCALEASILYISDGNADTFATNREWSGVYANTADKSKFVDFTPRTTPKLSNGDDLNNYTQSGEYISASGTVTNSLVHAPSGIHYSFKMVVDQITSITNIRQTIVSANIEHEGTGIFTRVKSSDGTWSNWYEVVAYNA